MRRYLSTLHKRSDKHKNNFALLVSAAFTLIMFSVWHFAHYGGEPVVADSDGVRELAATHEVGPFESLTASVTGGWEEVRENFEGLLDNLNSMDVEQGYEEMKGRTLDTYGR